MENYHTRSLTFNLFLTLTLGQLIFASTVTAQVLKALIPDGAVAQYAGSIGYGSAGISYTLFKNDRGSLDFTYGYVPESKGGKLHIFAGKFSYKALQIKVKDWGAVYPLNPGTFVSYHPGEQFEKWSKKQYPKGYYWWSKSVRYHLSLSTEAKISGKKILPKSGIKAIGLYSELNTNDLYMVSWFTNRDSMSFLDIVRVGYGVRVYF
jgi:hypothetical protein